MMMWIAVWENLAYSVFEKTVTTNGRKENWPFIYFSTELCHIFMCKKCRNVNKSTTNL